MVGDPLVVVVFVGFTTPSRCCDGTGIEGRSGPQNSYCLYFVDGPGRTVGRLDEVMVLLFLFPPLVPLSRR